MRGEFIAATLALLGIALPAHAQDPSKVDIEFALGQVVHPSRTARPSHGTVSGGVTIWFLDSWGIAALHARGRGDKLLDPPREGGDRIFVGEQGFRYTRVVLRYRRSLTKPLLLQLGAGIIVAGSRQSVELLRRPTGLVRITPRDRWGSLFAWEASVVGRFTRYMSGRAGITVDGGPESFVIQPTFAAVISF